MNIKECTSTYRSATITKKWIPINKLHKTEDSHWSLSFIGVLLRKQITFQRNTTVLRDISHIYSRKRWKTDMGGRNKKSNELWYVTPLQWTFFFSLEWFCFYTAGMQRHLQKAFKSNILIMTQLEYELHSAREWISEWGWYQW